MRQFGRAAAGARLGAHPRGAVVTAPEPLAALGHFSLGNSHVRKRGLEVRSREAPAGPHVEIGAAPGTEPFAIGAAQWIRVHREGQLLANRRPDVHVGRRVGQRVHTRVVLELGIGREQDLDRAIHIGRELGQAATADRSNRALELPMPVVSTVAGGLQISGDTDRPKQGDFESFKERVIRCHLARHEHRAMPKLTDINLEHSP